MIYEYDIVHFNVPPPFAVNFLVNQPLRASLSSSKMLRLSLENTPILRTFLFICIVNCIITVFTELKVCDF